MDIHDEIVQGDFLDIANPYEFYHIISLEYSLLVINIVLICLTILGNVYMIYFICGQKKARTTHNICTVSVAVGSILIAATVQPVHLVYYLNTSTKMQKGPFFMCKMIRYLSFWFKSVIMYSIFGMILNRYHKFLHPRSPSFLTGRCMFYLNFVWFSGAAYNIWKVIVNDSRILPMDPQDDRNLSIRQCCVNNVMDYFSTLRVIFLVSDFLVVFIGPFLFMLFMFANMIRHMCRSYSPHDKVKGARRILTSVLLALLFFICQLPYQIAETYYDHIDKITERDVTIMRVVETLSYMQGFCNVVAFLLCSREFHAAWRLTVCGPTREARNPGSSSSSAATHVLIRTSSCDNVVESICMR